MTFNRIKTAANIRDFIIKSDLSQSKIADMLFVSPMAVHKWVTGTSLPTLEALADLCTILECEPNEILVFDKDTAAKSA